MAQYNGHIAEITIVIQGTKGAVQITFFDIGAQIGLWQNSYNLYKTALET